MANLTISTVDVGLAAARTSVTVTLTDLDGNEVAGNLISSGAAVVVPRTATTAADGTLTLDLIAYTLITPSPLYYTVRIKGHSWLILKTAATQTLLEALAADPVAPTPTMLALKQDLDEKGVALGYAGLDAGGLVPVAQLPEFLGLAALADYQALDEKGVATGYPSLDIGGLVEQDAVYDQAAQPITGAETTASGALVAVEDELVVVRARNTFGGLAGFDGHSNVEGYYWDTLFLASTSKPSWWSWATWACFLSGGRLAHGANYGVGGDTSQEVVDRLPATIADAVLRGIQIMFFQGWTNNPSPGGGGPAITPTETVGHALEMVQACRAVGIVPVIVADNAKDFEVDEISAINAALAAAAITHGFEYIDATAAIMDPATGFPDAATVWDVHTHTNELGGRQIGERAIVPWLDRSGVRAPVESWLAPWDNDQRNLIADACFAGGPIAGGAPPGWSVSNLSTSGTAARTLVSGAGEDVQGEWLRYTFADLQGSISVYRTVTGWAVGDLISVGVRNRWAGITGDARWTMQVLFGGSSGAVEPVHKLQGASGDHDGGIATNLYEIPAGSTTCTVSLAVAGTTTNAGTVDFAQPTIQIIGG